MDDLSYLDVLNDQLTTTNGLLPVFSLLILFVPNLKSKWANTKSITFCFHVENCKDSTWYEPDVDYWGESDDDIDDIENDSQIDNWHESLFDDDEDGQFISINCSKYVNYVPFLICCVAYFSFNRYCRASTILTILSIRKMFNTNFCTLLQPP